MYDIHEIIRNTETRHSQEIGLRDIRIMNLENKANARDTKAIETLDYKHYYKKMIEKILATNNLEHAHTLAREALDTKFEQL